MKVCLCVCVFGRYGCVCVSVVGVCVWFGVESYYVFTSNPINMTHKNIHITYINDQILNAVCP